MYVYDMGIIDYFQGMTRLKDYINLCPDDGEEYEREFYIPKNKLKLFLMKCFMHVKSRKMGWEGDIRNDDCIAIGALPDSEYYKTHKFIAFKQNNNGSSFVVSECQLPLRSHDGDAKFNGSPRLENVDLILDFYEECLELVEGLFNPSKKVFIPQKTEAENNIEQLNDFEKIG